MSDDRLYLIHILECIERIESYTQGGQAEFMASTLIQDGVIRNFEIIGEATKRLTPELKELRIDIPWRQVAGFRDVLIHDYMGVDLAQVWRIVEHTLPGFKRAITALMREPGGTGESETAP